MDTSSNDCYEILGVEPDATIDQIKKAYRKLALRWHPDKNLNNPQEASQRFQLINRAWEILSDPNERAWYDEHREAIVRGVKMDADDFCAFMMPFFSPDVFSSYDDGPKGFYVVFGEVFDTLIRLEKKEDSSVHYPVFGTASTPLSDVLRFYNSWSAFTTSRSFAAVDQYKANGNEIRYVRRAMKRENSKMRNDSRKQYNRTVAQLVAVAQKFDPRYKEAVEQQQREQREREENRIRRQEEEKKRREEELRENMKVQVTQTEEAVKSFILDDTVYENTGTSNIYECIVCRKVFKSETAMENHYKSRKHIANVEKLRKEMMMDDERFSESPVGQFNENLSVHLDEESSEKTVERKESVEETPAEQPQISEPSSEVDKESHVQDKKKKNKRQKRKVIDPVEEVPEVTPPEDGELSVLELIEQMNSQNMQGRKARNLKSDDYEPKKKGKKGKKKSFVYYKQTKSTFQTTW